MGWFLPALAGAAGGFGLSKMFGGGDDDQYKEVANRFGSLEKPLTDYFTSRIGQKGPTFPGGATAAVAPMSQPETQSFDFLRQFGEGGFGPTFKAGEKQIQQTLANQFDPTTDPYYQAVKAESARNLAETKKGIASERGGGRYFTGARVAEMGRADTASKNQLDIILGALANQERDRAIGIIPEALQYEQARLAQPLSKAAAFQSLGALPRSIEQAGKTFDVGQFQQSEVDYPMDIASMLSALLTGNQPVLEQKAPSAFDQFLGGAGEGAGNIGMALLMQKLLTKGA